MTFCFCRHILQNGNVKVRACSWAFLGLKRC